MTSRARLLAAVLLLAPSVFACRKEGASQVATPPASPAPGVAATEAPPLASPSSATTPTPTVTAAPALSGPARPPAAGSPMAATTTQATQPQAPLSPATAPSAPPPTALPSPPPATQPAAAAPRPRGKITLPSKLGAVTFDHENHAGQLGIACTTCHHASRREKPLAAENQPCRDCHRTPAVAPMKTGLQAAFHDPKGATGTCIECHRQKGGSAPVKCLECHKRK